MKYLFAALLCVVSLLSSAADGPLKVCMLSASNEYESDDALGILKIHLEDKYDVVCSLSIGKEKGTELSGLDALDTSNVLLVFTRRLTLPADQLEKVKKHCDAGKPVIGIRTASHAFQTWLEFDKDVLGGNYKNHYGKGPAVEISVVEKAKDHPILAGVKLTSSPYSLYKNPDLTDKVELLLSGKIPNATEPIAWTHEYKGGRIFYTSLGGLDDFKNAEFIKLLTNALAWVSKQELKSKK